MREREINLSATKEKTLAWYRKDLIQANDDIRENVLPFRKKAKLLIPSCIAPDTLKKTWVNDEVTLEAWKFIEASSEISKNIEQRQKDIDTCLSWIRMNANDIEVWNLKENVAGQFDPNSRKITIDSKALSHLKWANDENPQSDTQSIIDVIHHEYAHLVSHEAWKDSKLTIHDPDHFYIEWLNSLYALLEYNAPIPQAYANNVSHVRSLLSSAWISNTRFKELYSTQWIHVIASILGIPVAMKAA